jgi:hypothetical protein
MMHKPGKTDIHHFPAINGPRPSDIMSPHDGVGGGTPTPKKLKDASMIIATPMVKLNSTITVFVTLGTICHQIMRSVLAPFTSASWTKYRSRRLSTSDRMMRVYRLQKTSPRITTMFHRLGFNTDARKMAKMMVGSANQASVMRMII